MATDVSKLQKPDVPGPYVFIVNSAKVKLMNAKAGGQHLVMSLGLRIAEGPSAGFSVFHTIWLKHASDPVESSAWQYNAVATIEKILDHSIEFLPDTAGEETDATRDLPGSAFEATVKLDPPSNGYPEAIRIARVLGAVDIDSIGVNVPAETY